MDSNGKHDPSSLRMLRLPAVQERTGEARSTTYNRIATGLLTPPIKLGPRASAWPEHEISAILAVRLSGGTDTDVRRLVGQLIRQRTADGQRQVPSGAPRIGGD